MMKRKNLIDGVPNSYNTNYVLETKKRCSICESLITAKEIEQNKVVCVDTFDFYHKNCLSRNLIKYKHYNPDDKSTPAVILEEQ